MTATKTPPNDAALAALYEAGDYERALRLIDSAVLPALEERPDDPDLAGAALLVANVYRDLARYSAAEPYYLKALAGLTAGGKGRPAYARGLAELAALYEKLGRDEQALELYAKARATHEAAPEPDPVGHARCLQGLAGLLDGLSRHREAVAWLRQAREVLVAARSAPGAFADLLLEEARVLCRVEGALASARRAREALALLLRHSGEPSAHVAYARYVLGGFLTALCELDEAAGLLELARRRFGEVLGESHPRYASALESQALLRVTQGGQREAEALARRALELTEATLGDRHLWTAESHRTLGMVLQSARKLTCAEECFESALRIARERFGEGHPFTAGLLFDVAELREASGRRREAAEMNRSALECLEAHADDVRHERAAACLALAQAAAEAGQNEEAEAMARRAADLAAELANDPFLAVPASLLRSHLDAAQGDVASALARLEQAERWLAALPPHHPLRTQLDAARAGLARMQGEPERAVALAQASVRRAEDTPWLPAALCFLAEQQHQSGELSDAESSFERALNVLQRRRGPDHLDQVPALRGLAQLHLTRGNTAAAEVRFRKAREIRKEALGDRHPDTAESLADLASLKHQAGDLIAAELLYREADEIRREYLGDSHPETLAGLHGLASVVWARGDSAKAAEMLGEALEPLEEGHPQREPLRHLLAGVCHSRGEVVRALELLGQVLAAHEKVLGESHDGLAPVLADLARAHAGLGDHLEARRLLQRIGAVHAASPYAHPLLDAPDLVALSDSHRSLSDLDRAGELAAQALGLARTFFPAGDPALLSFLSHSAVTCRARRRFWRASRLLGEAEGIVRRAWGERHPCLAGLWTDRAWLEVARGRPRRATPLFEKAADLAGQSLGEDHPDHGDARRALGLHLQAQDDLAGAEAQLRRHLSITRRTAGADHPAVALAHLLLSELHRQRGDLAAAVQECRSGLDLIRASEHPIDALHANALHGLAVLYRLQGKRSEAAGLFGQALEIDRGSGGGGEGDAHLDTQRELALVEAAQGQHSRAIERLCRVLAAQGGLVAAFGCLPPGPGRDSLLTAPWRLAEEVLTLSLQAPPAAAAAMPALALGVALTWNALPPAELVPGDRATLRRRHPADAEAIDRLFDLNLQIAGRAISGASQEGLRLHRDLLARWGQERERLEDDLAARIPSLARLRAWRSVGVDSIRRALPGGAALVELVRFRPRDFAEACAGREGLLPARYVAFVLHDGAVAMADVGPADVVEGRGGAEALRAALAPHLAGRSRLVVGHGGLRRAAWARLAEEVRGVRSGRELTSGLLVPLPASGWADRVRGWLGV